MKPPEVGYMCVVMDCHSQVIVPVLDSSLYWKELDIMLCITLIYKKLKCLPGFYNTFRMLFRLLHLNAHISASFYTMTRVILSPVYEQYVRYLVCISVALTTIENILTVIHLETTISIIREL